MGVGEEQENHRQCCGIGVRMGVPDHPFSAQRQPWPYLPVEEETRQVRIGGGRGAIKSLLGWLDTRRIPKGNERTKRRHPPKS